MVSINTITLFYNTIPTCGGWYSGNTNRCAEMASATPLVEGRVSVRTMEGARRSLGFTRSIYGGRLEYESP